MPYHDPLGPMLHLPDSPRHQESGVAAEFRLRLKSGAHSCDITGRITHSNGDAFGFDPKGLAAAFEAAIENVLEEYAADIDGGFAIEEV